MNYNLHIDWLNNINTFCISSFKNFENWMKVTSEEGEDVEEKHTDAETLKRGHFFFVH